MAVVLRVTTLKAAGAGVAALVEYYAGLAEDQARRDGVGRGPVDYYLDPDEPPGRWWGEGCGGAGALRASEAVRLTSSGHSALPPTSRVRDVAGSG